MADQQFIFAFKVSGDPQFDALLGNLGESVLKQVGYGPPVVAEILAALREALKEGGNGDGREGDVRFRAEAGQLIIVVSKADGRERRITRALPD